NSNGFAIAASGAPFLHLGNDIVNVGAVSVTITWNPTSSPFNATLHKQGADESITVDPGTLTAMAEGFSANIAGALSVGGDFGFKLNSDALEVTAAHVSAGIATKNGTFSVGVSEGSLALRLSADGLAMATTGTPALQLGSNIVNVTADRVEIS